VPLCAIEYGRHEGVTSLWALLQGKTMVRMASAVAKGTQLWDPLGCWLLAHGVDRFDRRLLRRHTIAPGRGACLICRAKEPGTVYDGLLRLVEGTNLYARLAMAS
jgi:hypothetical protein